VLPDKTSATHSGTIEIGVVSGSGQPVVDFRQPAISGTSREKVSSERISGSTKNSQSGETP